MPTNTLTDIDFTLEWKSPFAQHTDIFHLPNVDLHRDKFPLDFKERIAALKIGESYSRTFQAKDILDVGFSTSKVVAFESHLFDSRFKEQYSPPILYRFYPNAIAWKGLNTDANDYTPFRLISINDDNMIADCNHPLAKYYITLSASKIKERVITNNTEHHKKDISKLISSRGPGMQVPFEYGEPIFFEQYPFQGGNTQQTPKPQLDSMATEQIAQLHSKLLIKYSKVLDLMSGQFSYLADNYKIGLLTGVGDNEEALHANQRLDTYHIQNINKDTALPFEDNSFDDAICTLTIDTITDPLNLIREVARVMKFGGKFIVTFSDNGISPQTHSLWKQLHPFERVQLVLEYFRQSDLFTELNTFSKRGAFNPTDEHDSREKHIPDSVYGVWGVVKPTD